MSDAPRDPVALFVGLQEGDPQARVIPGSTARPCCTCGTPTMFSPATLRHQLAQNPLARFSCLRCAQVEGLVMYSPSLDQVVEVAAAGYNPADWPLRELWGRRIVKQ